MALPRWRGGTAAPLLTLALLLAALLVAPAAARDPAEFSSSVLLFYDNEYEPHYGQPISQCDLLLTRAKDGGSDSVQIVPTHYWFDSAVAAKYHSGTCYPDNWINVGHVDYFCSRWEWDKPCEPFTPATIERFRKGFQACLQKAHDLFASVLITPHLDDATKSDQWRNLLRFDPTARDSRGNTYWDVMIGPISQAVGAVYASSPGKRVSLSMQGEMGASVFFAPAGFRALVDRARAAYRGQAKLEIALLFNGGFVPGIITRGADPTKRPAAGGRSPDDPLVASVWGPLKPLAQWQDAAALSRGLPAARALLTSLDVIGFSCYPRVSPSPRPEEFEGCAARGAEELSAMGFDLKKWAAGAGKRLVYNELGVGGGTDPCKGVPAANATEAALFGWLSTGYPWSRATDPWATPELREFRRKWHAAALRMLSAGGHTLPISGAYLWSILSHDPQGIHPASSANGGTFRDDAIAAAIRAHNLAARRKSA